MQTITIATSFEWSSPVWVVFGLGLFAVIALVGFGIYQEDLGTLAAAAVVAALAVAMILVFGFEAEKSPRMREALQEQLHYNNVDLNGNEFVAATSDGKYVAGKLVELEDGEYLVHFSTPPTPR